MKTLIIYDSWYGNTEKIARAIAKPFTKMGTVTIARPDKVKQIDYEGLSLLIIGSPTHGGRPTRIIQNYLKTLTATILENKNVAVFDTRVLAEDQKRILKILLKIIDFAAPNIVKTFLKKGGHLVVPPEGFIVEDKEGPLRKGEIQRAEKWGKQIFTVIQK